MTALLSDLGRAVRLGLGAIGLAARLFLRLLQLLPGTLARFGLVRDQIHFLGT